MPFWSKAAVWLAPGLFEETKRTTGAGKASLIRESSPGRKICFVFVLVPAWCHLGIGHLVGAGRNLLSGLVASVGGTAGTPAARPANGAAGHATHMLLYLNEATFVGPEGALLADEV